MRKTHKIFFSILLLLHLLHGSIVAQNTLLDKEITLVQTTGSVEQLLKEISELGGFTFTYSNQIQTSSQVTLVSKKQSVRVYLNQLFPDDNVEYIISKNGISLIPKRRVKNSSKLTFTGTVYERETNKPVEYANVYLEGTGQGTTTNKSGEFIFQSLDSGRLHLIISHLSYENVMIDVDESIREPMVVILTPKPFQLQEVMVEPNDPLDIVNEAIDRIPRNYNSKPHKVRGFQREYATTSEGNIVQLMEVLFQTYGNSTTQSSRVIDARFMEDKEEKEELWSSGRGGFYTLGWAMVSGIEAPSTKSFLGIDLTVKNTLDKYYDFELMGIQTVGEQEIYVIGFDQKVNVRKPLLKGQVYISVESYAITKITHELSPRGLKFLKSHRTWGGTTLSKSPKKIDIIQDRLEINYRSYGDKWYLHSFIVDAQFDASLVFLGAKLAQKKGLTFHSERVVTAIDTVSLVEASTQSNISKVGSIPTLQNFIKKEYENYSLLNDEKWGNENFIKSDTSIAKIAERLRNNNDNWIRQRNLEARKKAISTTYGPRQVKKDLGYLKESLKALHPGLFWYRDSAYFEHQFRELKKHLKKKNTEADVFLLLAPLVENINCGHTEVYPSLGTSEYIELVDSYFPLDLWIQDERAIVLDSYNDIPKGTSVVSINGVKIASIIRRIWSNISSDGFNTTYKDFRIRKDFSLLYSTYFPVSDTFRLELDHSVDVHEVSVPGITRKNALVDAQLPTLICQDSTNTAILKIPSFRTEGSFPRFLKKAFREIKVKGIQSLVIDIRDNEGGPDEYGSLLHSYISREAFRYYNSLEVATKDTSILDRLTFDSIPFSRVLPDYSSRIITKGGKYYYSEHHNLTVIQPQSNVFTGKVFVLINGGTYSTAAEFAAIVKANNSAILLGQETGGGYYGNCSLGAPFLTLPNSKIRISIPLAKYKLAVPQTQDIGYGVRPDFHTIYITDDILNGSDLEMELCYELIKKSDY